MRLKVVRKMFELRFGEPAPSRRSVDQLRGIEGSRVRATYALLAKQYGVKWQGRRYDPKDWEKGDVINQCISSATSCLYGVTEAAILAAGYAPAIDLCTPASRFLLSMILPISLNLRSLYRKHLKLRDVILPSPIVMSVLPAGISSAVEKHWRN